MAADPKHDVAYARLRFDTVTGNYLDSMEELLVWDAYGPQRIGGPVKAHVPSLGVIEGANDVCAAFLDTPMQWLWWTDADMGFPHDILARLLHAADPVERPAVGALVFKNMQLESDGCHGYVTEPRPVILDYGHDPETNSVGFVCRRSYPANTVLKCDATGMACVVIHRSVHEAIRDHALANGHPTGHVWHEQIPNPNHPGKYLSPDISFWMRAGIVGKALHVHTGALTNHQKSVWVSDAEYRRANPGLIDAAGSVPEMVHEPKPNRAERRAMAKSR